MTGRNVVVCCDGTANEFAENRTNVIKLYSVLDLDPAKQVAYYHPGLGTMEPAGALTIFSRKVTRMLGKAIGYGLANDIRDAYVFSCANFARAIASSCLDLAEALIRFGHWRLSCICMGLSGLTMKHWFPTRSVC